jgi:hypothetical protein
MNSNAIPAQAILEEANETDFLKKPQCKALHPRPISLKPVSNAGAKAYARGDYFAKQNSHECARSKLVVYMDTNASGRLHACTCSPM